MEKLNRDRINRLLLQTVLLTACLPGVAPPARADAGSPAVQALLAKAKTLAAHGHADLAVQIWQQVLLSDPANREALNGIAKADMQLGKGEEARSYLDRLKNLPGAEEDVKSIEAMPRVQDSSVRLAEAGRLARAGNYEAAIRIYRDLYGNEPPAGNIALAYYDTEAALPAYRKDAVDGLRRLSQQFPANSRYSVTLGRILTYDAKTRPEGMVLLSQYSQSTEARDALRQAQQWNVAGIPAPQPPSVAGAVPVPAAPVAHVDTSHDGAGYRALNANRLDEAEHQFHAALAASPHDAQALSGLGYVRMRQRSFPEAVELLEQAHQAGATGKGLDDALALSRFWQTMGRAADEQQAGQKSGELAAALADYRRARQLRPGSPEAAEGVAGVLMQTGGVAEAASIYQQETQTSAPRTAPWRGLVLAQVQSGDMQAAVATAARVPREPRAALQNDPAYLSALARATLATGRKAEADSILAHALALPFPNHGRDLPLDQQMQYAELLISAERYEAALSLYRQILAQEPENAGAWLALISAEHRLHRDDEALLMVGRMPASVLEESEKRSDFLSLLGSVYQSQGDTARARQYLERAVTLSGSYRPDLLMQLASIYNQMGDQPGEQKAYTIYQHELDRNPGSLAAWSGLLNTLHLQHRDREAAARLAAIPEDTRLRLDEDPAFLQVSASIEAQSGNTQQAVRTFDHLARLYADQQQAQPVDVQLQHGWLLLKVGDDRGLYPVVQSLGATADMSVAERTNFHSLWASWTIRRAGSALAQGDRARAVALLETAHQAFPENADVSSALAGAYLRTGQPRQAVAVYASLDMSKATLAQYQGAIGAALAANDSRDAEPWLEAALARYSGDSTVLKMAAQYEQAHGDERKAAAYYRAALQVMRDDPGASSLQGAGQSGAGAPDSPAQELMRLLAPGAQTAPAGQGDAQPREDAPGYRPSRSSDSVAAPPRETLNDYAEHTSRGGGSGQTDMPITPIAVQQEYLDQTDRSGSGSAAQETLGAETTRRSGEDSLAAFDDPSPEGTRESARSPQPATLDAFADEAPAGARANGDEMPGTDSQAGQTGDVSASPSFPAPRRHDRAGVDLPPLDRASGSTARRHAQTVSGGRPSAQTELLGDEAAGWNASADPRNGGATGEIASDVQTGTQAGTPAIPSHFDPVTVAPDPVHLHFASATQNTGDTQRESNPAGNLQDAVASLQDNGQAAAPAPPPARGSSRASSHASGRIDRLPALDPQSAPALSRAPDTTSAQTGATQAERLADPGSAEAPQTGSDSVQTSLPPLRGSFRSEAATRPLTEREQVQQQLARIESGSSNWLGGTSTIAYRSGQPGLDRLAVYSAQVESSAMLGPSLRMSVITRPVLLDAGTPDGTATFRQGTLALTTTPATQAASGVGGEVQLRAPGFALSAGYTPYGFLVANGIGALTIHPPTSHVTLSLSRDAVQDTQLSYAGLRDAGSSTATYAGNVWGGVVSDAGELQIASGDATQGWYIQGGGQYLTGVHVPDNTRVDGDAGAYWAVWHDPAYGSLTAGVNFFGMHYQKNQRYFTYGQGGYFSPSAYLLGSVPVTFAGHYGPRFHYQVTGSLGVQAFSEDSAAYFPLDLATQIAEGNPYYTQRTSVSANYNFESEASYAIADRWFVGGFLDANNARDYASDKGGFFVRYLFRPQPAQAEAGPTGLFPTSGLRPLRVP